MRRSRQFVGALGGVAATLAFTVGAVSLTRIAGDYLGFPPGLEWTLTGAVDVAGIAGGIMWAAFSGSVRRIGRPMNIVCTAVSGVGVGLDHATHAGRALREPDGIPALPGTGEVWPWAAFIAGVFVPALATWILHALSVIADAADAAQARQGADDGDRQEMVIVAATPDGGQQTHRVMTGSAQQVTDPLARRQVTPSGAGLDPARQVGPSPAPAAQARQAPPPGPAPQVPTPVRSAAAPAPRAGVGACGRAPRAALASVPSSPGPGSGRPGWMTQDLLDRVVAAKRTAAAARPRPLPYGRSQVAEEHGIKSWQAQDVLRWIADHDLMRTSA